MLHFCIDMMYTFIIKLRRRKAKKISFLEIIIILMTHLLLCILIDFNPNGNKISTRYDTILYKNNDHLDMNEH